MSGFTSLEQVGRVLLARWRLVAMVAAGILVLTLGVTAAIRPTYTASAEIIFNTRASDPVADKNDSVAFNSYVSAEIDLINSRRSLDRLARDPAFRDSATTRAQIARHKRGPGSTEAWLAAFVEPKISVVQLKNSRTGTVSAVADDPLFAADLANGVARAYLATYVDLRVSPARQNVTFFREQRAARATELSAAQERLQRFLKRTGMTGFENRSDVDDVQLRALGERLTQSQAKLASSRAEGSVGGADAAVSAGAISNAVLQGLRAEIANQSAVLQDLTTLRGPNHPAVVQAKARLAELETQAGAEASKIDAGLQRRTAAAAQEGAAIGALERGKRASISASSANRTELAVLQGDVARAQAAFEAVATRLAERELASALDAPNASILSAATPPRAPSSPNWPLSLLFGFVAGALAGVLAAIVAELRSPRVRSPRDLEAAMGGAPVLCDMAA